MATQVGRRRSSNPRSTGRWRPDRVSRAATKLVIEAHMSKDPLDELIERLNKGDMSAAERAFVAYEPYLRMAVRRRLTGPLRTKLDSMDIVQSVWADVLSGFHNARRKFTDRSHLRAFLVKVARNRLID